MFHYQNPTILSNPIIHGAGTGVQWMTMKFKNDTDFDSLTISVQHAGRLLTPEVKDSTYKIER